MIHRPLQLGRWPWCSLIPPSSLSPMTWFTTFGWTLPTRPCLWGRLIYSIWTAPDTNLANLTEVFTNYVSNENPAGNTTGAVEAQTKGVLFTGGASEGQVLFDDFYLSTGGYNHTVPRPHGLTTGQGIAGALTISAVTANSAQIYWSGGTLQSAPSLKGPWTPVAGASVPYYTPGATNTVFYRSAF